jgi:hypothetical protein
MPGFGYGPFGHAPFGHTNYGREVITNIFPQEYLDGDDDRGGILKKYLIVIENSINARKKEADQLADLIDADKIREDILRHLGTTLDVYLDDFEPPEFSRSLVGNAALTFQQKATKNGYKIRGKISGYDVEIINFWKIPQATADIVSGLDPNAIHLYQFPPGSGASGIWYTDLPPGTISGVPYTSGAGDPRGEICDYCLSGYIKIRFILVKVPPGSLEVNFLDRVVQKLEEVKPIHVRRLFIDLEVAFEASVHPIAKLAIGEETRFRGCWGDRYDIWAADRIATDSHPQVTGIVTVGS